MIKRGLTRVWILAIIASFFLVLTPSTVSADETCNLDVSLINQDPYPVTPGNYVEVVFQVSGTDNSDCDGAKFKVIENYPFSVDPGQSNLREISGSTFVQDYKKSWMVPYRLRVDSDALDGMNEVEIKYAPGTSDDLFFSETFDIKVEDVRVDFEISVKDYDPSTKTITFEILNIGENDVEALTIDVPEQENLDIQGSPRKIVGSLDSSEETTFDFNAIPDKGNMDLKVTYTDEISERRTLNKTVYFNPSHFKTSQDSGEGQMSFWFYIALALFIIMIFRWIRNRKQKKKSKRNH